MNTKFFDISSRGLVDVMIPSYERVTWAGWRNDQGVLSKKAGFMHQLMVAEMTGCGRLCEHLDEGYAQH